MKKGLLITVDFWPHTGGVATYYTALLNHVKIFVPVILSMPVNTWHYQMTKKVLNNTKPKCRVIRASFFFKYFWPRWMRLVLLLWSLQKREAFEFFMVGDILPVGTAVWLLNRLHKKPYIIFTHGTDIIYAQRNILKRFLFQRVCAKAKIIISNSNYTKSQLIALGVREKKIHTIYPGLDLIQAKPKDTGINPRIIYNLDRKKIILGISRVIERKGIQYVLKALSILKNTKNDIFYVHIGSGPYIKEIKNKIKEYRLEANVLLREDADDNEKYVWLQSADVFVMTPIKLLDNDYEGFGMVYLEAAWFGLAIVASKTGGVPEAVLHEKTGLLVANPCDTYTLANTIMRLFNDDTLRARLGKAGKKMVKERFTWNKQAQIFESILSKEILSSLAKH